VAESPAALKSKAKTCILTPSKQEVSNPDERASFEEAATSNEMNNEIYAEK